VTDPSNAGRPCANRLDTGHPEPQSHSFPNPLSERAAAALVHRQRSGRVPGKVAVGQPCAQVLNAREVGEGALMNLLSCPSVLDMREALCSLHHPPVQWRSWVVVVDLAADSVGQGGFVEFAAVMVGVQAAASAAVVAVVVALAAAVWVAEPSAAASAAAQDVAAMVAASAEAGRPAAVAAPVALEGQLAPAWAALAAVLPAAVHAARVAARVAGEIGVQSAA